MFRGCFFLFKIFDKLQRDYKSLFGRSDEADKRAVRGQGVSGFFEQWGWDYSISLCVQDSGLSEDEIYKWNVIRFYNKLAYLKDKGKFEIELSERK